MTSKENQNREITLIACRVFQTLIDEILPSNLARLVTYLDYGLHVVPQNLRTEVQKNIDQIRHPGMVVLGYGLCGNGLSGIRSRDHYLLIPRTDDCIAILLGSYQEYQDVFTSEPGTYYLTKGWLEAGSNPLQEYNNYLEKYGQEKADLIMDMQYQNYSRLMFVTHNEEEIGQYQEQVQEIAEYCQRWEMRYESRQGSDSYIKRLVELMLAFLVDGDIPSQDDFIVVPPNTVVEQKFFMR